MTVFEFVCQFKECFLFLLRCLIHQAPPQRGIDLTGLTTIKTNKRLNKWCPNEERMGGSQLDF